MHWLAGVRGSVSPLTRLWQGVSVPESVRTDMAKTLLLEAHQQNQTSPKFEQLVKYINQQKQIQCDAFWFNIWPTSRGQSIMSYSLSPLLKPRFFVNALQIEALVGSGLYTYLAETTTPATTYSNDTGNINTNPIILDANGECNLYLDDDKVYRLIFGCMSPYF